MLINRVSVSVFLAYNFKLYGFLTTKETPLALFLHCITAGAVIIGAGLNKLLLRVVCKSVQ